MTDLDVYLMKSEIAYLRNRVEELENGSVYTALIREIGELRVQLDQYKIDYVKLEDVRRILG